jgi:ribosomal protein S18 acetylase RimI-like enzyme
MVDRVDVVRVVDDCRWEARSSAGPAGQVVAWRRPDRRVFVFFCDVVPEAYGPLVTAVDQDLGVELHTSVDLADERGFEHLCEVGFVPLRQESDYLIPVAEASEATGEARLADGYVFHNVLEIPEADLRRLDDRLRQDVPGTDGWVWDEQGFREETYASEEFDPQLYWIVAQASTGELVGLVRVWNRTPRPRLGLIAVVADHRRRGIGRALLGQVMTTLRARRVETVVCEVDDTNDGSRRLVLGLGARRVGWSVEMLRPGSSDALG